jgi:hypothetical protein
MVEQKKIPPPGWGPKDVNDLAHLGTSMHRQVTAAQPDKKNKNPVGNPVGKIR